MMQLVLCVDATSLFIRAGRRDPGMCQYIPLSTSWLPLDRLAVDSSANKYRRRCTRNTFKSLASTVYQLRSIYVEGPLIPLRGQDIAVFFDSPIFFNAP